MAEKRLIDSEIILIRKYICLTEERFIEELFFKNSLIIKKYITARVKSNKNILYSFIRNKNKKYKPFEFIKNKKQKFFEFINKDFNNIFFSFIKKYENKNENIYALYNYDYKTTIEILNFIENNLDNGLKRIDRILLVINEERYQLEGNLPTTKINADLLKINKDLITIYSEIHQVHCELGKAKKILNLTKKRFNKFRNMFLKANKYDKKLMGSLFDEILNKVKKLIKDKVTVYRKKKLILDKAKCIRAKEQYVKARSLRFTKKISFDKTNKKLNHIREILIKLEETFIHEITKQPKAPLGLDRMMQAINSAEACFNLVKYDLLETGFPIKKQTLINILANKKNAPLKQKVFKDIEKNVTSMKQDIVKQVYYKQFIFWMEEYIFIGGCSLIDISKIFINLNEIIAQIDLIICKKLPVKPSIINKYDYLYVEDIFS